nr:piggyBac transposable element-derived protein 3-like [Hydra vulgaris]
MAASPRNILSSFASTGVFPLNLDIISDDKFALSCVTGRMIFWKHPLLLRTMKLFFNVMTNIEKKFKTRFNVEEALHYVLSPCSDSELSDLEDDDTEEPDFQLERLNDDIVPDIDCSDEDDNVESDNESETDSCIQLIFRWRNKEPPLSNFEFSGAGFSQSPQCYDEMTPLTFFKLFWDDSITNTLVGQTNFYSVQKNGKSMNTNKDEIEKFLGMHMMMSIILLPAYHMYWAKETRYAPIADAMPRNRYKQLRHFLDANDNTNKDDVANKNNKLLKVQPILGVRKNCILIEHEEKQSIDEQIIPAKTKFSGIRQYNANKPIKWGFKNFVRAGASGMMFDFLMYSGACVNIKCNGEYVVRKLCETLPKNVNHKLFFDNWFTSLDLCLKLKIDGILTTATIRSNRIKKCPLSAEKELKKKGRGSSCYFTDVNSGLVLVRWFDNKCVQLVSTFSSPISLSNVKRWNRKNKSYVSVSCPEIVKEYNKSMGGVDLADMLISLYRTPIKTKRWYLKVIFH